MPRRPWRSTKLARARLQDKRFRLNDKFRIEHLHRAKEGYVSGAEMSTQQEWLCMEEDTDINFSNITIMPDNPAEPVNSGRAVKDIPGKETNQPLTNILLAGTPDAGGGGEVREEEHQEVQHGQGTQLGQDQQASPFLPAELVDLKSPPWGSRS